MYHLSTTARGLISASLVIVLITAVSVTEAKVETTWLRTPQPQLTLHELMVSLEERLRTLDSGRWEQRLDSMEASIRRLDTAFQDRLDKLERKLESKELKEELTVEKLSHKVRDLLDLSYDRYSRRLGYAEERLEMSFKKVQMNIETSFSKIEKQEEELQGEVEEAIGLLEEIRSHSVTSEDKLNSTHKALHQHIQTVIAPSKEELQRISGTLEQLGGRINNTLGAWTGSAQADGPTAPDIANIVRTEANRFTNKANNMYNDLWRRIISVETMVKDLTRLSNTTTRELLQDVRSLMLSDNRDFPRDSQENFIEVALEALERKLQRKMSDVGRRLEERMETTMATQNLVMDTCFSGGLCRSLESRLSEVLEKIFDVFSEKIENYSNRTVDLDTLVIEMMELMKNQHSQLIRTVTHNTKMVVTLTKDTSDTNKILHQSIIQLSDNFQELHDDLETLNTSGKICPDNEKPIEENTDQQKPTTQNITEIVIQSQSKPFKKIDKSLPHDSGVLKIATDSIATSPNNATSTRVKKVETSHKNNTLDSTIIQIINMFTTNLTQEQSENILLILNKSVNLQNVEAILQNTEAENNDEVVEEASIELYDTDTTNRTAGDSGLSSTHLSENILENEDISAELLEETTEAVETYNTTKSIEITEKNFTKPDLPGVSPDLNNYIKLFVLLRKIKSGSFNATILLEELNKMINQSEGEERPNLLKTVENLCYGEENISRLTSQQVSNIVRNQLLLLNKTITDVDFYEKIEDICNTITEFSIQKQFFYN